MGTPQQSPPTLGAPDAFEDFVRARSSHLFRLALVLSGWHEPAAQDLLQIALERAYRHRRLLFREGASAEPYVRRVLVNAAIDWRRGLRRRGEQPLQAGAPVVAVEDAATQVADRDLLLRALKGLPPKQRAVLVMRYWEDLPDTQIAAVLNCSVGTVRSQASRALARLRQLTGGPANETAQYSKTGEGDERS
ncbi:MAG TPA: SigE family RNA polymerase sigma factor [Streptosporangiaceae bacterium]